jgi:hypothetical protein
MSEAEKPTECPKCGSKAQKVITSFGSKTGNSIQPAREPLRRDEVDSRDQPALSSDLAGDIKPLPLSGHLGNGASAGRKEMAQKSLVQMLEELASKVRSLERQKSETVVRIQALEREAGELRAIIAQASEKVDEMLRDGTAADIPQPRAVNEAATLPARERLGEFSSDPHRTKRAP